MIFEHVEKWIGDHTDAKTDPIHFHTIGTPKNRSGSLLTDLESFIHFLTLLIAYSFRFLPSLKIKQSIIKWLKKFKLSKNQGLL